MSQAILSPLMTKKVTSSPRGTSSTCTKQTTQSHKEHSAEIQLANVETQTVSGNPRGTGWEITHWEIKQ